MVVSDGGVCPRSTFESMPADSPACFASSTIVSPSCVRNARISRPIAASRVESLMRDSMRERPSKLRHDRAARLCAVRTPAVAAPVAVPPSSPCGLAAPVLESASSAGRSQSKNP